MPVEQVNTCLFPCLGFLQPNFLAPKAWQSARGSLWALYDRRTECFSVHRHFSECPSKWADLKKRCQRELAHAPWFVWAGSCRSREFSTHKRVCHTMLLSPGGSRPLSGWEKNMSLLFKKCTIPAQHSWRNGVPYFTVKLVISALYTSRNGKIKWALVFHACLGVLWLRAGV